MAGTDLDDVPVGGGGNNRRPKEKPFREKVLMLNLPDDEWKRIRLKGKVYSEVTYWVCFKDKEGRVDPKKRFPVVSRAWNRETNTWNNDVFDPWLEFSKQQRAELFDTGDELSDKEKQKLRDKMLVRVDTTYYMECIDREVQKKMKDKRIKPTKQERQSGFKDLESDTPTPIRVARLTTSMLERMKNLTSLNVHEGKDGKSKGFSVAHPKRGIDVVILKASKPKSPGETYQVNIKGDEAKPVTEDEAAYLSFDIENLLPTPLGEKELQEEFDNWAKRMGVKLMAKNVAKKGKGRKNEDMRDDEDEDEDEEESSSKKASKGKGKGKGDKKAAAAKKGKGKSSKDEDDEDEDEDDEDEDDEDEDDEPKKGKGKKAPAKKGKKSKDEDEDDEDEDDEDDEDEDDDDDDSDDDSDDDEDEDDDDDSDDDEDDEDSDDDDEDDDDEDDDDDSDDDEDEDDEDEDDEPVKKGKGKKAAPAKKGKAPAKKGKKSDDDEDDEDEDDEDDDLDEDDEDEDDEPKKGKGKKGGKAPAKKAAKKAAPAKKAAKGKGKKK